MNEEKLLKVVRELRNALIVASNREHQIRKSAREIAEKHNDNFITNNEMQFRSLVEYALDESEEFKSDYEGSNPLDWRRMGE